MIAERTRFRLAGLEPDNLLAFLALLGLLKSLEESRPDWRPRAGWEIDRAPLRPFLDLRADLDEAEVAEAVAQGLASLASRLATHELLPEQGKKEGETERRKNIKYSLDEARAEMLSGRQAGKAVADIIATFMSDGVVKNDGNVEATPLCLMFGQGWQFFVERLVNISLLAAPPPRGRGKKAVAISPADCIAEALFKPWERIDPTESFRWDVVEDVRYALMANDPTSSGGRAEKGGTQHGANRLAAVGFTALPVSPVKVGQRMRANVPGGRWRSDGFRFAWPIWRDPMSLSAIIAFLRLPDLREALAQKRFGVHHIRESKRFSQGKFMNFSRARVAEADEQG